MIESDRQSFAKVMVMLGEVFGECSVLKQQAYWMALAEFPWEDVEEAALRALKTRRSSGGYPGAWPTPGDLIALMWNDQDSIPDAQPTPGRKALLEPRPDPEMRERVRQRIHELIETFGGPFVRQTADKLTATHAKNLMARGLEEGTAYRLAETLIHDPHHRSGCLYCQASEAGGGA